MTSKLTFIAILTTLLISDTLFARPTSGNQKQNGMNAPRRSRAARRATSVAKTQTPTRNETASPKQPDGTTINIAGEPFKGNGRARVVFVEFSDFECSYCGRFFADAYPQIDAAYVKTGKIKYVFRDFPLERLHANAFQAAEAANCANEQGKFWAMHDRLFANQTALGRGELPEHAEAIGLNRARFNACFASGKYAAEIRRDMAEGATAGVKGTPAFLIALATPNNPNGKIVKTLSGSLPFDDFKAAIDEALNMAK